MAYNRARAHSAGLVANVLMRYLIKKSSAMREATIEYGAEAAGAVRGLVVGRGAGPAARAWLAATHPSTPRQVRCRIRAADVSYHLQALIKNFTFKIEKSRTRT